MSIITELGPIVQSIISLTKCFIKDFLSFLAHIQPNLLMFLLKIAKTAVFLQIVYLNYKISLANDVVGFEQVGRDIFAKMAF